MNNCKAKKAMFCFCYMSLKEQDLRDITWWEFMCENLSAHKLLPSPYWYPRMDTNGIIRIPE